MKQPIILVAEDEPLIALELCETVETAGYAVDGPFEDISSAMLSFQKHKPDLDNIKQISKLVQLFCVGIEQIPAHQQGQVARQMTNNEADQGDSGDAGQELFADGGPDFESRVAHKIFKF